MMRWTFVPAMFLVAACSSGDGDGDVTALSVTEVTWNPSDIATGEVQAVAEYDKTVAVFGAAGVTTFVSGSVVGTDARVTAWRSAGVIPSASGLGMWLVGVDGAGHLQRVLGHDGVEDVSDRFGLAGENVAALAGSERATGFLLEQGLATSDGITVRHYPAPGLRAVSSGGGRVAIAAQDGVRIFDPAQKEVVQQTVALPDAAFVAYDAAGVLFSATPHALYRLEDGEMQRVYDAGGRTIHALASAGANVWLAVDGDLALVHEGRVAVTSGMTWPSDVRLSGSPSGDVWLVAGGQLHRYAAGRDPGNATDEGAWATQVQPIYATVCSQCHSAPGSGKDASNVDLSTYALWNARRGKIYQRVIEQVGTPGAMPPSGSGFGLTDAQRAAIEAWSRP